MLSDAEIKQLAKELLAARILEAQPTKERIAEIIRYEITRRAYELYDRESRQMTGEDVKQEIRRQLRAKVQEWLEANLPSALAAVSLDTAHLKALVQAEIEQIKKHVDQLVRDETAHIVKQAVGTKIGEKVSKLLALFDKVLVQP